MKRKLKPCPFCGGTEIEFEPAVFTGQFIIPPKVGCKNCEYKIDGTVPFYCGKNHGLALKVSNHLLVNWWNKRANENER